MRARECLSIVSVALFLAGCSNFISSSQLTGTSDDVEHSGESVATYSLPRGLVEIYREKNATTSKVEVKIRSRIVADSQYRFRLNYEGNWLSSDVLRITTKNGLVQSVFSRVEDRTYQVAVNLARSIGAVTGFTVRAAGNVPASPDGKTLCAIVPSNEDFKVILDPYQPSTWPKWVSISDLSSNSSGASSAPPQLSSAVLKSCNSGLCTRSVRPWRVHIRVSCDDYQDELAYLPDERDAIALNLERSMFVSKRFYLTFNNGMVSEVKVSKPSSAEALASLPESVLRAVTSVPAEFVQLRYNYSVERKDLTGAELSRLKQEEALRGYVLGKPPQATTSTDAPAPDAAATTKKDPITPTPPITPPVAQPGQDVNDPAVIFPEDADPQEPKDEDDTP